jgi:hypothetical protein
MRWNIIFTLLLLDMIHMNDVHTLSVRKINREMKTWQLPHSNINYFLLVIIHTWSKDCNISYGYNIHE